MKNKIIIVVGFIAFIAVIQIFNVLNNAVYHWEFILVLIGLSLGGSGIVALLSLNKYKKLVVNFNKKDYTIVLKTKNLFLPEQSEEKNFFYYMKAMACLETDRFDEFNFYVDKIAHKKILSRKYFLKIIGAVLAGDVEQQQKYKKKYWETDASSEPLKAVFDKVLNLLEKQAFSPEDELFVDSISFEKIRKILEK